MVTPPVTEDATEIVQFVDQATGKVVDSQLYKGKLNQTQSVSLKLPAGYKLAKGQSLPTQIVISNGKITIYVEAEGSDHPVNPDHPDNPDQPVNPDHPVTPDHPENSGQPTTPDQPAQPGNPGENSTVPAANDHVPGHIANDQSLSSQIAHHVNGTTQARQLPQTGNGENEKASTLGFLFAGLASIFGLAGYRKKKH
ncbi:LPXTG cell wall anchor domain-containing protein [Limosilactobacillus portuensis]|uniref:LPXTG cell wall anchor domain-containing protein n=1 Tax=Limosilactobacillus portuensis TaxID=2742601 RepID=UPI0039A57A23